MHIAARNRERQDEYEKTRLLAYCIAKYGNSDPKKFPPSPKKFMPFDWDDNTIKDDDPLAMAARSRPWRKYMNNG